MDFISGNWAILGAAAVIALLVTLRLLRASGAAERSEETQLDRNRDFFPSFDALMDGYVSPRLDDHPERERLDGASGVPGRPLAWFDREGTVYGVNGECRTAALRALRDWMREHPGEDPLAPRGGGGRAGRLDPRAGIPGVSARELRIETG